MSIKRKSPHFAPWDADAVCRTENSWLIFYDSRVVELHLSWDLTPEQMRVFLPVAKKAGLDAIETRYSDFDEDMKSKGVITNSLYYNLLNIDELKILSILHVSLILFLFQKVPLALYFSYLYRLFVIY